MTASLSGDQETRPFRFNGYNSAQINGDTVRLAHRERLDVSLLVGYKFNTVIGHGGGGGLVDHHGYHADRDASLPWLQSGLNAALLICP